MCISCDGHDSNNDAFVYMHDIAMLLRQYTVTHIAQCALHTHTHAFSGAGSYNPWLLCTWVYYTINSSVALDSNCSNLPSADACLSARDAGQFYRNLSTERLCLFMEVLFCFSLYSFIGLFSFACIPADITRSTMLLLHILTV